MAVEGQRPNQEGLNGGQAERPESAETRRQSLLGGRGAPESDIFAARPEKPAPRRAMSATMRRVVAFTWISIAAMAIYGLFMGLAFFTPGYRFIDGVAGCFLMLGVAFVLLHGFGYANSMLKAASGYDEVKRRAFSPQRMPKVVCVCASFNEPASVLEETVAGLTALDYPNKEIVILDDSTREEARAAVREIAAKYGVEVRQRTNRRGYKAGAVNDFLPTTDAQYLAVFDADALAAHNFLRDVVPIIEENPRLAFVQTPQFYANTNVSGVALAAARQQAVFYEAICEGKSASRAAFCCGTNVVFRVEALRAVKGFDESSVTEDFMTSLNLHQKGYDSTYYNQVYVYSLSPETLAAYFTQQSRWSFGSIGVGRKVLGTFFTKPGSLRAGQWWEYFLSTTYYWVGWVNFIFMCLPMLYIFFGIKPLRADVFSYLAVFIPYMVFNMNMFYVGMETRGYSVGEMLLGQQIGFLTFPVHMKSAASGIIGLKRPFGVTPKGAGNRMSWLALWPQLLMLVLSALAFVWGLYRYIIGAERSNAAIVINSMWAFYHVFLLSGLFRLNQPVKKAQTSKPYFSRDGAPTEAPALGVRAATLIAPPVRPGTKTAGTAALVLSVVSLLVILAGGLSMFGWWRQPEIPANVYILDRTTGRDYQEHRGLVWTLNYLKVKKDASLNPSGQNAGSSYNFAQDFYGFIPGNPDEAQPDPEHQGDLVTYGTDRPLPDKLTTPGVVYLADTYGEFVEYDYHKNKYVYYVSQPRGIQPVDVDKIQDFHDRGGLILGEWNTIGYPTLPGQYIEDKSLRQGIANVQKGLTYMTTVELPQRQAQLAKAKLGRDANFLNTADQQVRDTQARIKSQQENLAGLFTQEAKNASQTAQMTAQKQLEGLLHVHYRGWYGRYVDSFDAEHEYDFRMWKNVCNYIQQDATLKAKYPDGEPHGPGFVFYRDGASKIIDPEDPDHKRLIDNPFSQPVVIFQDELGTKDTTQIADIYKTHKTGVGDDPLLENVADQTPCRYWFDLVDAAPDSSVLSWYKLQITKTAEDRLRAANFPAQYLVEAKDAPNPQVVFPAAIAYRDGGLPTGQLKSFYFAGDASDYPLVSRVAEMAPSTGGIFNFLGHGMGPFSTKFYWNYYEPILRNVFAESKEIRRQQ